MPPRPSSLSSLYGPIRRPISASCSSRGSGGTKEAVVRSSSSAARSRELASSSRSLSPAQSASTREVLSSAGVPVTSSKMAFRRCQRSGLAFSEDNRLLQSTRLLSNAGVDRWRNDSNSPARTLPVPGNPPVEPTLCKLHFTVHRGFRDLEDLARLLRRASEEEPEFDEMNLLRVDRLQLI